MPVRLEWNGDKVIAAVELAVIEAIDETTAAAADDMRATHWWRSHANGGRRGLQGQVRTSKARIEGDRIIGSVGATFSGRKGVFSGFYGLFLERKMPWIRPAADRNFPTLPARLKRRLAK